MQLNPHAAAKVLNAATSLRPNLGIVLGSAFGQVAESLEADATVGFADLPGCAASSVEGHSGQFIIGRLGGADVVVQSGRLHYYEGYSMGQVTFSIRVMAEFGVKSVLLTNAAGGIAADLAVGDFMRITDHINLMGANPLRDEAAAGLPGFVDMSEAYSGPLGQVLGRAAADCGIGIEGRCLRSSVRAKLRDAGRDSSVRNTGRRRYRHEHRAGSDRRPPAWPRGCRVVVHHQRRRRLGQVANQPRGSPRAIPPSEQPGHESADAILRINL